MLKLHMEQDLLLKVIADYLVIPIIAGGGVMLLLVPARDRYILWAKAVLSGLTALLFAKIIAQFYQGVRPFEQLGVEPGAAFLPNPGFPSDHALLVFAVAAIVWATTKNKWVSAALLVAAILVAVGRVLALVHTPADVIGGALCAIIAAVCIYGKQFFTLRRQI
jgi:membrane-associated phospholipid phosphatase